jgi:4-hydroxy-3-methylbut-2-enyl diphosphate reductase
MGPLIHNPQALETLRKKGIQVLSEIPLKGQGTVLIRAHGVPPDVQEKLMTAGFQVADATCPKVIKVQTIIANHAQKGYRVIVVGEAYHPEVVGLLGFAQNMGVVINDLNELQKLPLFKNAIVVAQTTQSRIEYDKIRIWLQENISHYIVFSTICASTEDRQREVEKIMDQVDALIVVGGLNSGNTRRLAQIGQRSGKPTYHVETEIELDIEKLRLFSRVGVTAGASTPNWIIHRVIDRIKQGCE